MMREIEKVVENKQKARTATISGTSRSMMKADRYHVITKHNYSLLPEINRFHCVKEQLFMLQKYNLTM